MASGEVQQSLKGKVSDEEWAVRVELAALFRLVALHGWDDLIFTHISARLPGPDHTFLINPFGMHFEEITASSLVRVAQDGTVLQETQHEIQLGGFLIHAGIHMAREDAKFVLHLHTDQGVAVSAQTEGLLPISQNAISLQHTLAYHDFAGFAHQNDECAKMAESLGNKRLLILRNHGTLSVGETAGNCWMAIYYLERACKQQVMALSAGRDGVTPIAQSAQDEVGQFLSEKQARTGEAFNSTLAWPVCLRRLERHLPGYDI